MESEDLDPEIQVAEQERMLGILIQGLALGGLRWQ